MCQWCDIIAGSSAPISLIQNLFSQNQHKMANTGKQIFMVGRPEVLSQSLPSFRYRLPFVYRKSLNVSEQNCNVYWSKVWIQLTPKLMCAIYSTAVPLSTIHMYFVVSGCVGSLSYVSLGTLHLCWSVTRGTAATSGWSHACSGECYCTANRLDRTENYICEAFVFIILS